MCQIPFLLPLPHIRPRNIWKEDKTELRKAGLDPEGTPSILGITCDSTRPAQSLGIIPPVLRALAVPSVLLGGHTEPDQSPEARLLSRLCRDDLKESAPEVATSAVTDEISVPWSLTFLWRFGKAGVFGQFAPWKMPLG